MSQTSKVVKIAVPMHYIQLGLLAAILIVFVGGAALTSNQNESSWLLSPEFKEIYKIIINTFYLTGVILSVLSVMLIFGKSFKENNGKKFLYLGILILLPCISAPFVFRSLVGSLAEDHDDN